ncbi:hypothetical protein JEQ12_006199 [Ovis aries]|uniref:Tripartite motif-containing protein 5-like n=1 Tax=Ovis aries TaxID=9940 RepID=A0A836CUT5_SHEEP|nr:hypothetical protein JEQ12_006199 [Ovis aries]
MASEKLVNLQEEVTCPICLELLTEPLSLDCGHSFCQICITANSKESVTGQEEERKCPVCRINYESGKLRPNWHLANIVQRVREVKLSLQEQEKHLCAHHGEKLVLFCEEDGKVICWLCERSQEHRGHPTVLMEEVAQEYQKKLQTALERLKQEQQEAEELESDFREEIAAWKSQTQYEIQNVQAEFEKLRAILDSEETKELQKLKVEETATLCTMANSENELAQQSQLVRNLISEIEHRLRGSTMQMLQDVNDILKRSNTLTLKKPKPVLKEQRSVFRAPDLRDILRVFSGLRYMQRYWVDVTLSHTTGNRNIAISADRRQVTYVHKDQRNNRCWKEVDYDYGVLGSPVITSGRHYWENEIQHERENIQADFLNLREILNSEELKERQNLKPEEEVGLCNLGDSENELVQQSQLVRDLISDVEHHFQEPKNEMLQATGPSTLSVFFSFPKTQIENEMQSVQGEFTKLRQILDSEEAKELRKLKDELGIILKKLAESENDLVQEKLLVSSHISDVERHLQGSTMELLQDVNVILKRSKTVALKEPKTFPKEQRRVFRAPDLREILRVFTELTNKQRYWVQVTLNSPKNANVISPHQRQVRYASRYQHCNAYSKDNYEDFGVLGSPVITSGRHYWEVDVSEKRAWILGICDENCKNIMKLPLELGNYGNGNCQNVYSLYKPKNGNCGNVGTCEIIQIQNEIQSVQGRFTQLREILDSEEAKELRKLQDELGVILKKLAESENDLVQEMLLVNNLISDVEHRLQGSTMELLQDVNVILKRSEIVALKEPKTFPKEQRRVFRAPDLREILRVFNELTDAQQYWVQVTPNSPKSANVISLERRQVRYASSYQHCNAYSKDNYGDFGVLGSPVITSGRHYWEVDVSKKRAWILGICGEQCKDIMKFLYDCENYGNRNCRKGFPVLRHQMLRHLVGSAASHEFSGPDTGKYCTSLHSLTYSCFSFSGMCHPEATQLRDWGKNSTWEKLPEVPSGSI